MTFNGTGDTILAGCDNGNIFFIDAATSQVREPPMSCDDAVLSIALKDNMIAAGCYDGKIMVFNINESQDWGEIQSQAPLRGHSDWVRGVAFNPSDPRMLVSCSDDGTIKVWNITSGACSSTLKVDGSVSRLDFSTCGTKIAAASNDWQNQKFEIKIFNLNPLSEDWEIRSEPPLTGHTSEVEGVVFSADGQWLIAGFRDGMIRLLDDRVTDRS